MEVLRGSDHIIHAGDIGGPEILDALGRIAPVLAVRGNNDRDAWADTLPETALVTLAGVRIHVLHDLKTLARGLDGVDVVIAGHSHRPLVERRGAALLLNPGSAGPRRFRLPVTVARLALREGERTLDVEIVPLLPTPSSRGSRS